MDLIEPVSLKASLSVANNYLQWLVQRSQEIRIGGSQFPVSSHSLGFGSELVGTRGGEKRIY
jgi:hypothetical protein